MSDHLTVRHPEQRTVTVLWPLTWEVRVERQASSGKILSTESEWTSVLKDSTSLPDPHKEISAKAAEQEAPESMASDKDI